MQGSRWVTKKENGFCSFLHDMRLLLSSSSVVNPGEFSNVQQRGMPPVIDAVTPVVTGQDAPARWRSCWPPIRPQTLQFSVFPRRLQGWERTEHTRARAVNEMRLDRAHENEMPNDQLDSLYRPVDACDK